MHVHRIGNVGYSILICFASRPSDIEVYVVSTRISTLFDCMKLNGNNCLLKWCVTSNFDYIGALSIYSYLHRRTDKDTKNTNIEKGLPDIWNYLHSVPTSAICLCTI